MLISFDYFQQTISAAYSHVSMEKFVRKWVDIRTSRIVQRTLPSAIKIVKCVPHRITSEPSRRPLNHGEEDHFSGPVYFSFVSAQLYCREANYLFLTKTIEFHYLRRQK